MSRPIALLAFSAALLAACQRSEDATGTDPVVPHPPAAGPVASLVLTPRDTTLEAGQSIQYSVTAKDASARGIDIACSTSAGQACSSTGRPVSWTSTNPGVATVSVKGFVTAIAPGSTTLTTAADGKTASASIVVRAAPVELVFTV